MIDIVVVNYNTLEYLRACVESALRCTKNLRNLVVVDNESTDGSQEWLAQNSDLRMTVIFNRNLGYAHGLNRGIEVSNAPYVACCNADIEFTPEWDTRILDTFTSDGRIAIVGPKMIDEHNRITAAGVVGENDSPFLRGWHSPNCADAFSEPSLDCISVCGACLVTKRSLWNDLGGFDEGFDFYYEETFYCYLARHRGYRVVYNGTSVIKHFWNKSPGGLKTTSPFDRNRNIFRQKCDALGISHD